MSGSDDSFYGRGGGGAGAQVYTDAISEALRRKREQMNKTSSDDNSENAQNQQTNSGG